MSDVTDFSWRQFFWQLVHGYWQCGWDTRKPLPTFGGVVHTYYDGHWYAARLWRFYVCLDPYPDRSAK